MADFVPDPFIRARVFKHLVFNVDAGMVPEPRWLYEVYDSSTSGQEGTLVLEIRDSWQEAFDAARFDLITQLVDQHA